MKFLAEQAEATLVVSVVSRMELLSFPGLTSDEETVVREFLDCVTVAPLDIELEAAAIRLRRSRRLRLPDAIVAATALRTGGKLVTGDRQLLAAVGSDLPTCDPFA